MNTRNHEDIARTAGLPLLRDVFAKDMRRSDALCSGKPHSCLK
jgi:hypothetical protein